MRQPWLDETSQYATGDDFSPRSATRPAGRVAVALAIAVAVLVAGTASELALAVLDLPILPGTETLIAAAQRLDEAMRAAGLVEPHAFLREQQRALEAMRF